MRYLGLILSMISDPYLFYNLYNTSSRNYNMIYPILFEYNWEAPDPKSDVHLPIFLQGHMQNIVHPSHKR